MRVACRARLAPATAARASVDGQGPSACGARKSAELWARNAFCTCPGSPCTPAHARPFPPPGHRLTTASVDAQATKSDEAWTPEEEEELVKLVAHEEYRKVRLGDTTTKWAPIAAHFSRTVKAVKRKFDKLQNPSKGVEGGGKRAGVVVEFCGGCLGGDTCLPGCNREYTMGTL